MAASRTLLPAHRKLFDRYLAVRRHSLSAYAFDNICLWRALYEVFWYLIDDSLCVFFRDRSGCFMFLPPLGGHISKSGFDALWRIMDRFNRNRAVSRIENLEDEDVARFKDEPHFKISPTFHDYVYRRGQIAALGGNAYKAKRAGVNYFLRNNLFEYRPFLSRDARECRELFTRWRQERQSRSRDPLYQGLLQDNSAVFSELIKQHKIVRLQGRVVLIDKQIKAFSFGYPVNNDTFCIMYEVADLGIKGLAQFIFRQFCRELTGYSFINVMDDSGLDNLKRVKLSYRPYRLIRAYNVTRAH